MSDRPESFLLGDGRQLTLLADVDADGLPAEAYELSESVGRFTGERIFSANPQLYRVIAALLGRSMPYREISEVCCVSVNTVCAVSLREKIPIETIRERVARMGLDVSFMSIEAIRDLLADPVARSKLGLKELAIAFGIATQNAQLLSGGATARLETVEASPGHEEYQRLIRNVTGTGLSGETPPPKEAPIELPAAAPSTSQPASEPVQEPSQPNPSS